MLIAEQMLDEEKRLDCLRIAVLGREGHGPDNIIEAAKSFYKFVTKEKIMKVTNTGVSENELIDRAVAPRVTLEAVEANIVHEAYFTAYEGVLGKNMGVTFSSSEEGTRGSEATEGVPEELRLLTFCVLTLKNGFTVHGVSACAAKENYNRDIGERIARGDAVNKIWPLMGYTLRSELSLTERAEHISDELTSD